MSDANAAGASRWARVNDLFHRALEVEEDDREALFAGVDPAVAREVRSLLTAHERPDHRLEPRPIQIGPFRILEVLGQGGMGIVYRAEDTRLGRIVALKAVPPQFSGDARRRERLRQEARTAAALGHPGIATIYSLEEIDGHLYLATEYVPGETLRDELHRGPLTIARAVDTVITLARAVAVAHARGVVHRDLKPENIIRTPSGALKILDFGLARMIEGSGDAPRLTADGSGIGTPGYMSPEQIRGGPVDARSDVFALGVIFHELIAGTAPFASSDSPSTLAKVLEAPTPALPAASVDDDAALRLRIGSLIQACLAKDAARRPGNAEAIVRALEDPQARLPTHVPATSTRALRWWQFHLAATAASYVLLLVPLWGFRNAAAGPRGTLLFLAGLTAVVVASALRLHLLFTVKFYREEWRTQRGVARRWILAADLLFIFVLLLAGVLLESVEPRGSALLVASAAAIAVSCFIIEPATTRAALDREQTRAEGR